MALDEAPPFWWKPHSWQAWALWPIGYVYGRIATTRMTLSTPHEADVPVLCVGNFIVGGGGKTPTVELICKHLTGLGMKPGVLSRGHGGAVTTATVVDLSKHNAHDVGDEPLLHAANAVTVVSADRPAGAELLIGEGCDIIVMDDGFQNPSLHKDYSLIVVDSRRGLGNGFTMPAGPMRIPLKEQIMKADAVVLIGDENAGLKVVRSVARAAKPVFHASTRIIGKSKFADKEAIAFAGIADPSKFYDALTKIGVTLKSTQNFGDHHLFTEEECGELIDRAKREKLQLLTTTKDLARLKGMGRAQDDLAELTTPVPIRIEMEDPATLDRIITKTLERFEARKLAAKPQEAAA